MTGIVKGYEIGKNRDGTQNVLLLQVAINSADDVQPVEYMNAPGDNTIPPMGSIVTVLNAGRSWKIAVAANDGKDFDASLNECERYFYSKDEAAKLKLLNNGTVTVNDGSTEAARNGDAVRVTIPAGTFIVSVSGGSGSPAVGVLNPAPIDVDGTIIEGTNEVLFP